MLNKKGFLFVVTVFLILTYILLSISVWVKSVEASERAYAEFYKESTVELVIEQITPAKMGEVADVMMNRAVFRLNENAIDSPVKEGEEENEYIRKALFELLVDGSADSDYFIGTGLEQENTSLNAWASNLNTSLLSIGVYISDFKVSNFDVGQSDMNELNYSFDMSLQLKDYAGTSSVSRTYKINRTLDVSGLVDPALARESRTAGGDDLTVYRQFFFNKDYSTPGSIDITRISNGEEGQGWLYAPVVSASGEWDVEGKHRYILVGDFSEIEEIRSDDLVSYRQFAGYIITSEPTTSSTACGDEQGDTLNPIKYSGAPPDCEARIVAPTAKPFIVAPDFTVDSAPECPVLIGSGYNKCVLFVSPYLPDEVVDEPTKKLSNGAVYGVEEIRDFVMCGYYTHNPEAPSYLQRLLDDSYSRSSPEYGIETFVIGEYANDYGLYNLNSRLDRELFDGTDGIKIRGLPGCKDFSMCSDSPVTGIFAASTGAIEDYGLGEIDCASGAGCGS
jgi:hypothetical protein